jgi:DNA-binding NarL/FixJ family response regulator
LAIGKLNREWLLVLFSDGRCPRAGQTFGEKCHIALFREDLSFGVHLASLDREVWVNGTFYNSKMQTKEVKQAESEIKPANSNDARKRILLVDDHAVVRFGIAQLINRQADLVVCGEQEDARKALDAIVQLKPDLVVADLSLKDSSGLELIRNIKAQFPSLPMLVVSVHDETIYAEIAFRAGALGYLMKQEALEKIITAIRRVLSGNVYVSDSLAAKMLQQQVRGHTDVQQPAIKSLSDREVEVFHLIGQWKKTKEIAGELHLSVKTVEYYREQIKRKLNLKDASELTQYATAWVQREVPA